MRFLLLVTTLSLAFIGCDYAHDVDPAELALTALPLSCGSTAAVVDLDAGTTLFATDDGGLLPEPPNTTRIMAPYTCNCSGAGGGSCKVRFTVGLGVECVTAAGCDSCSLGGDGTSTHRTTQLASCLEPADQDEIAELTAMIDDYAEMNGIPGPETTRSGGLVAPAGHRLSMIVAGGRVVAQVVPDTLGDATERIVATCGCSGGGSCSWSGAGSSRICDGGCDGSCGVTVGGNGHGKTVFKD